MVNPGDEVVVAAPYWVSYRDMVQIAEGKAVIVKAGIESDFKITPQQLEAAITPKTKVFMFSSPSNPTGSLYTREELEAFAKVFEKNPHVYILSDEIYEFINFDGKHESIAQFESVRDRVIIVNGVSKGYAMTGWRLGYLVADKEIAKACTKLQGQFTSGTNSIAQRASITAMEMEASFVTPMLEKFKERRDLMLELLKDVPGLVTNTPEGAFYLFPDASYYFGKKHGDTLIANAPDLCMYLINTAYVAIVPGDAFGAPECIRISYATSNELLVEAVARIKTALSNLK
jgi:aspartate aminotransferase